MSQSHLAVLSHLGDFIFNPENKLVGESQSHLTGLVSWKTSIVLAVIALVALSQSHLPIWSVGR